jgi:hypothetical protein
MGVNGSSLSSSAIEITRGARLIWDRLYVQCEREGANLVNNLPGLVTKDPNLQQLDNLSPIHPQHWCQLGNDLCLVSPVSENGG